MTRTPEGWNNMSKFSTQILVTPLLQFLRDEGGATAIEYAMIASGIAVAIATTIVSLGSSVQGLYTSVSNVMK
jgi:pilus assembly protein Flp/PilA